MKSPIFISGLRKSGTSLVKNLLDNHPELFVFPPNELELFHHSDHPAVVANKKQSASYKSDPKELLLKLADVRWIQQINSNTLPNDYATTVDIENFNEKISKSTPKSYSDVYKVLFESMADSTPSFESDEAEVRFVSKTVLETEHFPFLKEWFPDCKFVYVLRNPYAHFVAARTSMRKLDKSEDQEINRIRYPYPFIGSELRRMQLSYYFMKKYSRIYSDNFQIVVFDDLLQNPERELRRLARFLDIEYTNSMTEPTICGELWGGNSYKHANFSGIDQRPLHHWEGDISDLEIKIINDLFGNVINEYGFQQLPTNVSLLRPLGFPEWPHIYLANRIAYLWQKMGTA